MTLPDRLIVLIEDIDDNRELLKSILEMEGFHVIACDSGEAGLLAVAEHNPAVVIIDIGLPGIDGYEVARRLSAAGNHQLSAQTGRHPRRLLALSGYDDPQTARAAIEAGFDAYINKPISAEALVEILHRMN